jgi:hypothetical protein
MCVTVEESNQFQSPTANQAVRLLELNTRSDVPGGAATRSSTAAGQFGIGKDILTSRQRGRLLVFMKMLTLRLPEELHKALKIRCVTEGVEMNAVVTSLIENYLKESKTKSKPKSK